MLIFFDSQLRNGRPYWIWAQFTVIPLSSLNHIPPEGSGKIEFLGLSHSRQAWKNQQDDMLMLFGILNICWLILIFAHWYADWLADWRWLMLTDAYWCLLIMIDANWCWLMMIGPDWFWLMLIGANWCWFVMIDADWFWLVLIGDDWCW